MSRRKPDARNPTRSATKGGGRDPSSRDQRPNRAGASPGAGKPGGKPGSKPRPYGSQGKPGRGDSRSEGGRPEGGRSDGSRQAERAPYGSGGRPGAAGKRHEGRKDDRRDDRQGKPRGDFAPRRPESRPESSRPPRDQQRTTYQEGDRAERHGNRSHGGDTFSPRHRDHRGDLPVWLYGSHAVLAALENDERLIRRLLLTRDAHEALSDRLPRLSAQPEIIDRMKLDSLLPPGAVHQGIAMLTDPLDDPGVESLKEIADEDAAREVVLLLDHVTDPRNVGAILRSAAAFGARAVIVTDRHAPEATGALAKAASGGLEVVPLIRVTNLARALDLLAEYGFWRVGLEMETDKSLAEAVHDIRRVALVLGAEDDGLRRLTREKCDFLAKLPMTGAVESLNVSAAAAVALYECVRA